MPTISVEQPPAEATEPAEPQTGGVGAGGYDPGREDSSSNDKPPPPGSPEEAFEQACEQNPAACG